jgi:hypothetical protein
MVIQRSGTVIVSETKEDGSGNDNATDVPPKTLTYLVYPKKP